MISILKSLAIAVATLSLIAAAWMLRWSDPVPIDASKAVMVDRWSGDVWLVLHGEHGAAKGKISMDVSEFLGK